MATRKFRNTWWVDFRFEGVRYRKRSPENSKKGALAYEARLRERLARTGEINDEKKRKEFSESIKRKEITFSEFSAKWLNSYVKANNKPSEQYNKAITLRAHLVPYFGAMRLSSISAEHIEQYKACKRKAGLSERTVNLHLGCLAKCLRCAHEWGNTDFVPIIKKIKAPTPEMSFLTPQESDRLLEYTRANEPIWHPMILTALRTGMRRGELFALHWEDVDLNRRKITVRRSMVNGLMSSPKSHRTRYVPISPELITILSALARPRGHVFLSEKGTPMGWHYAHKHLHRIMLAAGVKPVQWHAFRHTFASQLASAGVPLTVVKELLGHSDIQMTMRYAHFAPSLYDSAVDVLDGLGKTEKESFGQHLGNTAKIESPKREITALPIPNNRLIYQQKHATV